MKSKRHKTWRNWAIALILPACFAFWFITAPACMAVQRIVAGSGGSTVSRLIIRAADFYEAPLYPLCKYRWVNRVANDLADWWCDALDAPDTTP